MNLSSLILSPYFPKNNLEVPMRMAKDIGPARSPNVLEMPRPFSAKVEAHWLTACSLAPAQTIIINNSQKILFLKNSFMLSPVSFSSNIDTSGTFVKENVFRIGRIDQMSVSIFQLFVPKKWKNKVENSILKYFRDVYPSRIVLIYYLCIFMVKPPASRQS